MGLLDFPSIIIASTNDPYATIDYAKSLAKAWGSAFVNVGDKGHINSASDIGSWEEGNAYLGQLQRA
jgi:predicted alpha/beta hydrolase family esterase